MTTAAGHQDVSCLYKSMLVFATHHCASALRLLCEPGMQGLLGPVRTLCQGSHQDLRRGGAANPCSCGKLATLVADKSQLRSQPVKSDSLPGAVFAHTCIEHC